MTVRGAALATVALASVLTACAEDPDSASLRERPTGPSVTASTSSPSPTASRAVGAPPSASPRAASPTTASPRALASATRAPSPRKTSATTAGPRSTATPRPSTPAATATPRPTSSPTPAGSGTTTRALTIRDFAFSPRLLTVPVGTSVRATNQDGATHDWTSDSGVWGSGDLDTGQSFTFTFRTAGTFDYLCERHPQMTGTVTVTPG